jgi:hypothetical protein
MLISCLNSGENAPARIDEVSVVKGEDTSLTQVDILNRSGSDVEKDMSSDQELEDGTVREKEDSSTEVVVEVKADLDEEEMAPENDETVVIDKEIVDKVPSPVHPEIVTDHSVWDGLLMKHVSAEGTVNYSGMKSDVRVLDSYLDNLRQFPPTGTSSSKEVMAYWINAYNAFTVKLILDNYPISSIMKIDGGKAWDRKWITIGVKTYSLNDIEHNILRKKYKDARIHFAVNCAAKSCPPLANKAWTAENIETLLNKQASNFINDRQYNQISSSRASISKIFEWYAEDFGDIISYLNRYSNVRLSPGSQVSYNEYDWKLNGK